MYFGDHPVSPRWGVHVEGQWRRAEVVTQWQQLLLRPGVNYHLRPNVMFTAGYGYIRTYPYGDFPAPRMVAEHRIYQQALTRHRSGLVTWQQRFRLEQRFLGEYRNRFRYLLRADVPVAKQKGVYLGFYDEVMVGFGTNRGPQRFDQNRAYGAVGFRIAPATRLEVGYMHQFLAQRNGRIVEHNHTLQVAVYSNLPWRFGR